jgi:hypothetical protein
MQATKKETKDAEKADRVNLLQQQLRAKIRRPQFPGSGNAVVL